MAEEGQMQDHEAIPMHVIRSINGIRRPPGQDGQLMDRLSNMTALPQWFARACFIYDTRPLYKTIMHDVRAKFAYRKLGGPCAEEVALQEIDRVSDRFARIMEDGVTQKVPLADWEGASERSFKGYQLTKVSEFDFWHCQMALALEWASNPDKMSRLRFRPGALAHVLIRKEKSKEEFLIDQVRVLVPMMVAADVLRALTGPERRNHWFTVEMGRRAKDREPLKDASGPPLR